MKKNNFKYLLVIPYSIYLILNTSVVSATTSSNYNYNIDIQNIDTPAQNSNNASSQQMQIQPLNQDPEDNITAGIISLKQASPLSFSISDGFIDFGILSASNPVTRVSTLSLSGSLLRFQVQAFEDHPLLSSKNQSIADTTCDNGYCSEQNYSIWENNLTYGFGFSCDGGCFETFPQHNYKQFANNSNKEKPQPVMEGYLNGTSQQAQLTFKVNASGDQSPGSYSNTITFIAIPNY